MMGTLGSLEYDEQAIRDALSKFIILDELPFKLVEGIEFIYFMPTTCPRFCIPSHWTVQRDCYELYWREKTNLKNLLKATCQRVCLAMDTWTSIRNINYMCLTVHLIDIGWKFNKKNSQLLSHF